MPTMNRFTGHIQNRSLKKEKKYIRKNYQKQEDGRFILRNKIESLAKDAGIDCWLSPSTLTFPPKGLESTGSPLMNLP